MNKESKLNLNAGDYAISHCDSDKTYNGLEVHKMLCDAYIAGNNDTLEDDDERIKNSLINLIKMSNEVGGLALHKWEADEMLAWLEKQGEKKPLGYVHHIDEDGYYTKEAILEPNPYTGTGFDYNGHHWGMCARDGGVEILMDGNITSRVFPDKNNIIEQKPADSYCQENCKGFQETGKCFADGSCKAKREAEQNPAWSEEDSFRTETLISVIKSGGSIRPELRNEYVNWLKSLRPQNYWKPSDEQIKVCKEVYADILSAKGFDLGTVNSELNRLEEELKKLKEE